MTASKIPQTDSINELASFWDQHDLTDFDDELEEVAGPVFHREAQGEFLRIYLEPQEVEEVERIAAQEGVELSTLLHNLVIQGLLAKKSKARKQ